MKGGSKVLSNDAETSWTIPLNLALSKTGKLESRSWRFEIEGHCYAVRFDRMGPEWMTGFSISPVATNLFTSWLELSD